MKNWSEFSAESLLAQAGFEPDPDTGAVIPPLHASTTFARDGQYELMGEFNYGRYANPTARQAEKVLAKLDGAADALTFSAGLAAVAAVFETLETGQHIVAPTIMYHGALDWFRRISEKHGIGLTLFDATEAGALEAAARPGETAIVWIESPVNPTWDVIDIAAAAKVAHDAGAILAVDATVAPPVTMRALDHGADLVFHSATKYLNGHSDVVAVVLTTARRDARWEEIQLVRKYLGSRLNPFDAWLLLRGLRTLFVRYERASENAMAIARHFESHPKIERVLYPGLESHPGHEIAKRQMTGGFGGMLSICVDGDGETAKRVATSLKLFVRATSLGGVESLIEHRKSVEGPHSLVPANLLRISTGLEKAEDLIADLDQALEKATA